jgi:hypothetical protein
VNGFVIGYACLLLVSSSVSKPFVDEDRYLIRAGDLEMVLLPLHRNPAIVTASYTVQNGSSNVRIVLVSQEDFDHAHGDPGRLPEDAVLASTGRGAVGAFTHRVSHKGDYLILLDNRADKANATSVQLRVMWDYPRVTQLSPERQFTVVALSCLTFFAVVTYSARKLLKAAGGSATQK